MFKDFSRVLLSLVAVCAWAEFLPAQNPPLCEVIPEANHEAVFLLGGNEATRWNFGNNYPRPYLYPLRGPTGISLTRMGHPGAPDHDHHQSVWFAHHDVEGESFWANGQGTKILQKQWLAYEDGDEQSTMACLLGWYSKSGEELLEQELVIALLPNTAGEYELEIQSTFRPSAARSSTTLGKTNFGLLAVRVSKSIAAAFGGGRLTDSEGRQGEEEIFGKSARWMDYSGKVHVTSSGKQQFVEEGISFMDHPDNPRHPTHWHVRSDGWMGASFGMHDSIEITREKPLSLRYCLWIHRGKCEAGRVEDRFAEFSERARLRVQRSSRPHVRYEVQREKVN
ncbi:MAG: PmoA family protein [Planctomycetota bacterium]